MRIRWSGNKRQQAEEVRRAKREAGEANAFGANKHFRCRQQWTVGGQQ